MKGLYRTQFEAQIALANKRDQTKWKIEQNANGWWIVVLNPATRRLSLDAHIWQDILRKTK
jgi:hypothetical protein